jgi:hypothetical protein
VATLQVVWTWVFCRENKSRTLIVNLVPAATRAERMSLVMLGYAINDLAENADRGLRNGNNDSVV